MQMEQLDYILEEYKDKGNENIHIKIKDYPKTIAAKIGDCSIETTEKGALLVILTSTILKNVNRIKFNRKHIDIDSIIFVETHHSRQRG